MSRARYAHPAPEWTTDAARRVRDRLEECAEKYDQKPGEEIDPKTLCAPAAHEIALSFDRPLVVGGRGVGKSYLAHALCDPQARRKLVESCKRDRLDEDARCFLGFAGPIAFQSSEENARYTPTAGELDALAAGNAQAPPDHAWRAVLCRYLMQQPDASLKDLYDAGETRDAAFRRHLDAWRMPPALMICDALDRLGNRWDTVRNLSKGALQLALDLRGFKRVNVKVFLRHDQFQDEALFNFPDASKLRAGAVHLDWTPDELYELLFRWIRADLPEKDWNTQFAPLLHNADEEKFRQAFEHLAGEHMGGDRRRGFTYTWVPKHLADTAHQVSPRSFMVAMGRAAQKAKLHRPIDYHGIHAGVQAASEVRVSELQEDHRWVRDVLQSLSGLAVPCLPSVFKERWKSHQVVRKIVDQDAGDADSNTPAIPISLENARGQDGETELLNALIHLNVAEIRQGTGKVNMPDLYRVAAKVGRRGGVPIRRPSR